MLGRHEVGIGDDQPGLDAGAVERVIADGADAVALACRKQPVPQRQRLLRCDEQLVAEIAGEAGARDGDRAILMRKLGEIEQFQFLDAIKAGSTQYGERGRPLQRQAGDGLSLLGNGHVEADGAIDQPGQMPLLAA